MSSPAEQFPHDPEDPGDTPHGTPHGDRRSPDAGARSQGHRRRLTLQEQIQATLAKKVAKAARVHRRIAKDSAKRARALADLRQWSSDPVVAKLLNPAYTDTPDTGPLLTDADASRHKVAAWEDQEIARRTVISEVACTLHLADRTAENMINEAEVFAGPMKATQIGRAHV